MCSFLSIISENDGLRRHDGKTCESGALVRSQFPPLSLASIPLSVYIGRDFPFFGGLPTARARDAGEREDFTHGQHAAHA